MDPRSIQWLLGLGGALFVLGLVIWLATLGIFKNHVIVAVILGLGNVLVLGLGWLVTARTRYQTAGLCADVAGLPGDAPESLVLSRPGADND